LNVTIPYHLSAFHTLFNVINTCIMLFFIRQLAKLTTLIIPRTKREKPTGELVFLNARFAVAPELAIEAARKEIELMTSMVNKMLSKILHALKMEDDGMFNRLVKDVYALEKDTDTIEYKINTYLTNLAHGRISTTALNEVLALMDIINTVERMGDSGEKLARTLEMARAEKAFSEEDIKNIEDMSGLVTEAVRDARASLLSYESGKAKMPPQEFIAKAQARELLINNLRNTLRDARNAKLAGDTSIKPISATYYADVLSRYERIGDHALKVVEASINKKTYDKEKAAAAAKSM